MDHDALADLPTMSGPTTYVIRVRGRLSAEDCERLGGMAIAGMDEGADDAAVVTTLRGRLTDQAALMGVLNALYTWQLPVLSIQDQPASA